MMSFKLGDTVVVLDEDLTGVVRAVHDTYVSIETEDGFVLDFPYAALIPKPKDKAFHSDLMSSDEVADVIAQKAEHPRRKRPVKKTKQGSAPAMEVDLHIHQLIDSTKGMSKHDILNLQLDTAKRKLEFAMNNRIQRIVFIHGVGEGVLRLELEYLFKRYDNLRFYDANYQKYGSGATEVYIYQNANPKN